MDPVDLLPVTGRLLVRLGSAAARPPTDHTARIIRRIQPRSLAVALNISEAELSELYEPRFHVLEYNSECDVPVGIVVREPWAEAANSIVEAEFNAELGTIVLFPHRYWQSESEWVPYLQHDTSIQKELLCDEDDFSRVLIPKKSHLIKHIEDKGDMTYPEDKPDYFSVSRNVANDALVKYFMYGKSFDLSNGIQLEEKPLTARTPEKPGLFTPAWMIVKFSARLPPLKGAPPVLIQPDDEKETKIVEPKKVETPPEFIDNMTSSSSEKDDDADEDDDSVASAEDDKEDRVVLSDNPLRQSALIKPDDSPVPVVRTRMATAALKRSDYVVDM